MEQQNSEIVAGLDIGTTKIACIVGRKNEQGKIEILGMGKSRSDGVTRGVVSNIQRTVDSIRAAVREAEDSAGVDIATVNVGIAGQHIRSMHHRGLITRQSSDIDEEIRQADIDKLIDDMYKLVMPAGEEIIHVLPQEYMVDGEQGIRDPIGMSGVRLDTRVHIITGAITALQNIQKCVNRCGLHMEQIMLQPLASGQAVLTEDEKDLGVCVIDIGGGTTDIAVYTNGAIRHTAVIPVAGDLITKDLAQALRTPHNAAEYIKIHHGVAIATMDGLDEMIEVPSVGDRQPRQISRRVLASVIGPRVEEISELTLNELRRSGFPEDVLTSGVVLTGGASLLTGMVDLAEDVFNLPARIGVPQEMGGVSERIRNPRYATAIGLLQAARGDAYGSPVSGAVAVKEPRESLLVKIKEWLKNNF